MSERLFGDAKALAALCRRHHILSLRLFGSELKGTATRGSDVDLLVEFTPGRKLGLLALAKIEGELSALLAGRQVDLRTIQDLSPRFRDEVERTALVQYAA